MMRDGERGRKYEGTVISVFLPSAAPAVVLPLSLAITSHCHSCLQSPLTTCAALPSQLFGPSLLHPHK